MRCYKYITLLCWIYWWEIILLYYYFSCLNSVMV